MNGTVAYVPIPQSELLEMKTITLRLGGTKNRSDTAGEKTSELEAVATELMQNKTPGENRDCTGRQLLQNNFAWPSTGVLGSTVQVHGMAWRDSTRI